MIGHFAAAVGLHYGNAMGIENVRLVSAQAKRKYRRMFDNPELVGGFAVAAVGVGAHGVEGAEIVFNAAPDNLGSGLHSRQCSEFRPLTPQAGVSRASAPSTTSMPRPAISICSPPESQ